MADPFGTPVAGGNTYNPQQGMQTLGALYNIKTAQAQLANTQASLPGIQAQSQQEQQTARQRAAVAAYLKSTNPPTMPDGTLDLNKFSSDPNLKQAAGDSYPQVLTQLAQARQGQLENLNTLSTMDTNTTAAFGSGLGSMIKNKDVMADGPGNTAGRELVDSWMENFAKQNPEAAKIADIYRPMIDKAPPGKLPVMLSHFQQQAMAAANQHQAQLPVTQDVGGNIKDINLLSNTELLSTGNPSDWTKTLTPEQQPGYKGMLAKLQTNSDNFSQNISAASNAPTQLNQIDNALNLLSQVKTGAGAESRFKAESAIAQFIPGFDKLTGDAAKGQELGKFLERVSAMSDKMLGTNANTDARLASAEKQNASLGYANAANKAVLDYAYSQTLAMKGKGEAMTKWQKQAGNSITNEDEFESKWRDAYDPVVFQLATAKTPAEKQAVLNSVSPEEAASLREKRKALVDMGVKFP